MLSRSLARRGFSRAYRILSNLFAGFAYGSAVLRDPITSASAFAAVQARMKTRAPMFLDTVERTVFANPSSPYRPLLEAAGYDVARLRALILGRGVEAALRQLCGDGIYVSIEEFKGLREARRGSLTLRFNERDFHNPLTQASYRVVSSGTRSAGIETAVSVENLRRHSQRMAMALAANGLEPLPMAVWLPQLEITSFSNIMRLAAMRHVPERWFTQVPGWQLGGVERSHAYYVGISLAARLQGLGFPPPTYVPFGEESRGLTWIAQQARRKGCAIFTIPSAALRLAVEAKRRRVRLVNVTFFAGGEPLTPAKLATIEAVGARACSRFSFSEFGTAAYGCGSPSAPDDMHICKDAVAIVDRRRPADRTGSEVAALLFTSLQPDARRILLNMETGDYAKITQRQCGCLLEQVGWTEHLEDVRSFEKLNLESWAFLGSKLIALVEELLPDRFGGGLTDYQLVEHEDGDGQTRLTVLVHPRLGTIDEAAVLDCVEETLGGSPSWLNARVYRRLETLQLRRAAPMPTRSGKVMPLHHLGPSQAIGTPRSSQTLRD